MHDVDIAREGMSKQEATAEFFFYSTLTKKYFWNINIIVGESLPNSIIQGRYRELPPVTDGQTLQHWHTIILHDIADSQSSLFHGLSR